MSPHTRLGPYGVGETIGSEGMGEVYRARDTRLDGLVAVKVLPARIAADADALWGRHGELECCATLLATTRVV